MSKYTMRRGISVSMRASVVSSYVKKLKVSEDMENNRLVHKFLYPDALFMSEEEFLGSERGSLPIKIFG